MKRLVVGLLMLSALASSHGESLLEYYDSELIGVNYHTFGGFSFLYQGVAYSATFGLEKQLRETISTNPAAAPLIKKHVANMRTGWIFTIIGAFAFGFGSYLAATIPLATTDEQLAWRYGGAVGLCTGGAFWLISGPLFTQAGYSKLFQAVNIYNRDKIEEYGQR